MKITVKTRAEILARGAEMLDDLAEHKRELQRSHYQRLEDSLGEPEKIEFEGMKTETIEKNRKTWERTRYFPPIVRHIVRDIIKSRRAKPLREYLESHAKLNEDYSKNGK